MLVSFELLFKLFCYAIQMIQQWNLAYDCERPDNTGKRMKASHIADAFIIQNQFYCLHMAPTADCKYDRIILQNSYWQDKWVGCLVSHTIRAPLKTVDDNVIKVDDSSHC